MINVDRKDFTWREGLTLADVMGELRLNSIWLVKMNGKTFIRRNFDKTLVPDNAEIYTVLVVGG